MKILKKILYNQLFKDSIWSVMGTGGGNALLLLSGVIIARLLGKDLYGEYGIVKTTMFQIAAFSTFGLGYTSTKFIAENLKKNIENVYSYVKASFSITIISSISLCLMLFLFSKQLAEFVNEPRLCNAFRYLGVIMVFRALSVTSLGVLAGFKKFKAIGISNILSGIVMLVGGAFFTYYWSVQGSLFALLLSQILLFLLCVSIVKRNIHSIPKIKKKSEIKLLKFSFPVAMQEFTYTLSCWGAMLIITKYASLGEVGIWSAAAQWNAIALFIPTILTNVVLSYLSGLVGDAKSHDKMVMRMLVVNFTFTFIPFFVVFLLSDYITSFYGRTFVTMRNVMNILLFSTVFISMSKVFQSNLISKGKNWSLFSLRVTRDIITVIALYVVVSKNGNDAALHYAIISVVVSIFYVISMTIMYYKDKRHF